MDFRTAACLAVCFALGGCYTRFASIEQDRIAPGMVTAYIDSSGKTVKVVRRIDTVKSTERETCIWERDLIGLPYLRCYKGYYPSQWYLYNYSPWWYGNTSHLYNADRCPPYYYFDRSCGCCRYYLNNPDLISAEQSAAPPHAGDTHAAQTTAKQKGIFSPTSGVQVQSNQAAPGSGTQGATAPVSFGSLPSKKDSLATTSAADSAAADSSASKTKTTDSAGTAIATPVNGKAASNSAVKPAPQKPPRRPTRSRE